MNRRRKTTLLFTLIAVTLICNPAQASTSEERERDAKQKKLDAACEKAREKKIAPLREQHIQECIDNGSGPAWCRKFYADYGNKAGKRAPLFTDLPECVKAFEFRKSYRSAD